MNDYTCETCGITFASQEEMDNHECHSGETGDLTDTDVGDELDWDEEA